MTVAAFGTLADGRAVQRIDLGTSPGPVLTVLDLGATVQGLEITGGDGARRNVVLGQATPADYEASTDYLGSTIGRYANRIARGRFELDELVDDGAVAAYGVSVETCAQALDALTRTHLTSVQIILNAFRLKPLDEVVPRAAEAGVAVIARVPLASGLLSGRYDDDTTFAPDDHRSYNRDGSAFDVGETFSGVDYHAGVAAAREFSALVQQHLPSVTPAQAAIAWVAQQDGVTTVIPGARNADQARANARAGSIGPLPTEVRVGVRAIYDEYFREVVHPRW